MKIIHFFIVNYFSEDDTLHLVNQIADLSAMSLFQTKIHVLDNGSDNEKLNKHEFIDFILKEKNIGLSAGWVKLEGNAKPHPDDTLIFINNDVILENNFFDQLFKSLTYLEHSIVTPVIYDLENNCWSAGGKFKYSGILVKHFSSLVSSTPYETDHVSGCCMIMSKKSYDVIGGFDPAFFFRGEEWDFNYRAKLISIGRMVLPDLRITHKVNGSHDPSFPKGINQAFIAKKIYWKKHFPRMYPLLISLLIIKVIIFNLSCNKHVKNFSDLKIIFKGLFSK